MSKYQTEIEDLIWEYNTSGKDLETAMLREIGHVYSQAAKADEYEVKAKAWDELYGRVKKVEKEVFGTGKPIVPQKDAFARLGIVVSDFIYDEYESGDHNV